MPFITVTFQAYPVSLSGIVGPAIGGRAAALAHAIWIILGSVFSGSCTIERKHSSKPFCWSKLQDAAFGPIAGDEAGASDFHYLHARPFGGPAPSSGKDKLAFCNVAVSFKEKRPARATWAGYREIVFNGQLAKNSMIFRYRSNAEGSHAKSDESH